MLVSNVTINTYSKIGYLWNAFKNQILQPKADQWNWSATLHTSSYIYILFFTKWEKLFFLKQLHWERKLHFRDCILHVPPYLIALKSFWSTAKCCETNEFLLTKSRSTTKILGKKSCELEFRFNAALPPILRCGEFSWPIHTVAFQDLILWKLNLSISWFNGEER